MRNPAVTMKTLVLLTLMCFLQVSMCSVSPHMMKNDECCPNSSKIRIPFQNVRHVKTTPEGCEPQAIVVETVANKTFCLDPSWKRAINLLEKFEGHQPPTHLHRNQVRR
ncbi:C-C motif chemokine 17-like [Nerophis lumbriciformis]|uniref:C-C motif chemokine 17-like n=1 Tax=Nerophis lumbriciformis TaxID=546530 RepID=UPI003BA8A484